jgi:L-alanine-DL-glutamate epimerase-like enolase superfamily enzyme
MTHYGRLADLPLTVVGYRLEGLEATTASGFHRLTTLVLLEGLHSRGVGEDVNYEAEEQRSFRSWDVVLPLGGRFTLAGFSALLDDLELFPRPPRYEASRHYRRWAFESAALDLALRQAGVPLAAALGVESDPVRFVASMGLAKPPSTRPLRTLLERVPDLRFKLDVNPYWDEPLIEELRELDAVDVVDLKGAYHDTPVDLAPDPELYARVIEGLPGALIEDPAVTPATEPVLRAHWDRVTWDAPIHSLQTLRGLERRPNVLNVKPSRLGSLRELCAIYDYCEADGIRLYGGGQFELGVGRAQIQTLASLFHGDSPNDVAPTVYNVGPFDGELPPSPLPPVAERPGFGACSLFEGSRPK